MLQFANYEVDRKLARHGISNALGIKYSTLQIAINHAVDDRWHET